MRCSFFTVRAAVSCAAIFIVLVSACSSAFAWHDTTHLAVAKAAGYYKWFNAAGPDMAKLKAGRIEAYNHFYNNPPHARITPEIVLKQAPQYNNPDDKDGHLYGAVIASLRQYLKALIAGKYAEYNLAYCIHYITDLSQPLHNMPYDSFNRAHHNTNDGIVNKGILNKLNSIKKHMYKITIDKNSIERDLSRETARIANISYKLGMVLKGEKRDMTAQEAYMQLGHSASLIHALLHALAEGR